MITANEMNENGKVSMLQAIRFQNHSSSHFLKGLEHSATIAFAFPISQMGSMGEIVASLEKITLCRRYLTLQRYENLQSIKMTLQVNIPERKPRGDNK